MNSELTPEKLLQHLYHDVCIVSYGEQNISFECNDCQEVIADADADVDVDSA